jgi:cytochrome c biogenesis factor
METKPRKKFRLETSVGSAAFLLALVSLGIFGWYVPANQDAYRRVYGDFNSQIPPSTKILLSIPDWAIWILVGLLAAAVLLVQFRARDKTSGALFQVLIILGCCVAFLVYREVLQLPMWMLMEMVR